MYQNFNKGQLTLFLFIFISLVSACRNERITASLRVDGAMDLVFLEKKGGAEYILSDSLEGFFDKITKIDMAIQMKKEFSDETPRKDVLTAYKKALQEEVMDFETAEVDFVKGVFKDITQFYSKYSKTLLPEEIQFIKVRGDLYGGDVFYTRGNAIIIPAPKLSQAERSSFTVTMIHELFHVISRNNPQRREVMYQIFGFEKLPCAALAVPDSLQMRLLTNPDGVSQDWGIRLKVGKDSVLAVPLIYARTLKFDRHDPDFMSYLKFDLFEVDTKSKSDTCQLKTKGPFGATLDVYAIPDFFVKTGRNTNYIIHPDEILADNFELIYTTKKDPARLKKLTPEGRKLLELLEKTL